MMQDKLAASEVDLFVADEEREALAYELEVTLEKLKLTSLELSSLQEKHASLVCGWCCLVAVDFVVLYAFW